MKFICISLVCSILTLSTTSLKAQNSKKYARKVHRTEKKLTHSILRSTAFFEQDKPQETPDLYWIQDFIATMNPNLLRPTPEVLLDVIDRLNTNNQTQYSAMPGGSVTPWVERGPADVGGRTRALAWDPWTSSGNKVWAGGITGGLWYNDNITSSSSAWQHVSSLWSNLSVSAIAFDPVNTGTMYVGTGEGYGSNTSTSRGYGIWKSTDSGRTFTRLTNTSTFYYVNDIVVRNESGTSVVYAAVDANYFGGNWQGLTSYGLYRSTNGGSTWTNVIGNAANSAKYAIADLELDASNNLWAGTRNNAYSGSDKGGGRILYSTNGTTWNVKYTLTGRGGRVELGCAPGNSKIVYAAFEYSQKCDTILVTHDGGSNWSKLSKPNDADLGISALDFTRNQAWYDLIIAVDPNDTNTVVIGGIDLFRSTNGGSSWSQISKWSNNKNLNTLSCAVVHADQHEIAYKPGSSSTCIFGTDGGVYYTSSLSSAASSNVIFERNKSYITSQFYWGDLSGTKNSNLMIGGMQDNGTVSINSSGLATTSSNLTGGDGGYCFISPSTNNKQITSYVYNNFYYTTNGWGSSGNLISDATTGKFINPAEWDETGTGLFTGKAAGAIYRIKLTSSPGSLQTVTWSATGAPSSIDAFPVGAKTRLFVGTDAGKLYVTEDAWATTPSFSNITGTINAGNISDVYNLRSGDTVAVVLSNYGVKNVYISPDKGSTWISKDGNLPDQPVWSIVLNPDKLGEAVIATETGVYGTTNIFASSPTWSPYTEGMGAVKVATLRYRSNDKVLMAVTHGRGIFTSDAWGKNTPIAYFGAAETNVCSNKTVTLVDSSLNDPTQWLWEITPATHAYVNGTDSSSQNPVIQFNKGGLYSIKLTASNQLGSSFLTRSSFINVTDTIPGEVSLLLQKDSLCAGDTLQFSAQMSSILSGSISNYSWKIGSNTVNNTDSMYQTVASKGNSFQVTLTSTKKCVSPSVFSSAIINPVVLDVLNPAVTISSPNGCSGTPLTIASTGADLGVNPTYDWYVDNAPQGINSKDLTINAPVSGNKVFVKITVDSKCAKPSNTIQSNTVTLNVFSKPTAPSVSRNLDTLFAQHPGNGSFQWFLEGSLVSTSATFMAVKNGNYRCVYSENGCTSDSSQLISITNVSLSADLASRISVFPVPAKDVLYFSEALLASHSVNIYNNAGVLVKSTIAKNETSNSNSVRNYSVDVSDLSAGVYWLKIETTKMQKTARFIIR